MTAQTPSELFARLDATGIGYAGVEGAWWLPALHPFHFASGAFARLRVGCDALFALIDSVAALYGTRAGAAMGLDALVEYKVPPHVRRHLHSPVLALRPDFQITGEVGSGQETFVATELEICPSAQGFAYAMQRAAGLAPDLAESIARWLEGRTLLIVATQQWSEFLFDQAAFCRALAEQGAVGRVLLDVPLAELDRSVRAGERWQPPIFGLEYTPPGWNPQVIERLETSDLRRFVDDSAVWPERLDDTVVFRFGYLDCFRPAHLRRLAAWEAQGAPFLNPCSFIWDSKALMAAARLPKLRAWLAAEHGRAHLDALDDILPETRLVTPESAAILAGERAGWVLKFAGFDGGNNAWGGRSLRVGVLLDDHAWHMALAHALALPFPVVAQRLTPSAHMAASYATRAGGVGVMLHGVSRLRIFLVRRVGGFMSMGGAHLTLSQALRVHEASDSVQGAVVFGDPLQAVDDGP